MVVYTAQDEEFATPIFAKFTDKTAITVEPKFDSESTKTVGLYAELVAEAERPRADVFWNNEPINTLRLEKLGLLDVYRSPEAEAYPAMFRSPQGTWAGFAARARVLIVNTKLVAEAERPKSIEDLADPKWKGKTGMAKPMFGANATHAACLFAYWGPERAKRYYRSLKKNEIEVLAGNKQVAVDVSAGKIAFGIVDSDDAVEEIEHGRPVAIVYPDQQPGGMGTLFFPNTLSVIKGCPHLGRGTETGRLSVFTGGGRPAAGRGPERQIPLNPSGKTKVPARDAADNSGDENRLQRRRRPMGRRQQVSARRIHGELTIRPAARREVAGAAIIGQEKKSVRYREMTMATTAKLSLAEYERIVACGVFDWPNQRQIELIHGVMVEHRSLSPPHAEYLTRLTYWGFDCLPRGDARIRVRNPLAFAAAASEPEPDLAWVRQQNYSKAHPTAADVELIVEVADVRLEFDRTEKAALYAEVGIQDYWVVNLIDHTIEVYREPVAGSYQSVRIFKSNETAHPLAAPEAGLCFDRLIFRSNW